MGFIVGKTTVALMIAAVAVGLSGCMGLGQKGAAPDQPATQPPVLSPGLPDPSGTCGAAQLSHLIGQDRSAISGMRFAHPLRVIEPGQPVTMDLNPDRLNIQLTKSGKIAAINCG